MDAQYILDAALCVKDTIQIDLHYPALYEQPMIYECHTTSNATAGRLNNRLSANGKQTTKCVTKDGQK